MADLETIISAGIDIGTTTTQLVFSRLTLNNTRGYGVTPKIEIVQKELLYQSRVYFTPLKSQDEIDGPAVGRIIKREYERAGLTPAMIHTGAVIITGETSRKQNARSVCREISEIAGDFVVAAAGPDLEAILAGKGAGCQEISQMPENLGKICCNFDIGGGTTNLACFSGGTVVSTGCFDIGGRLIRLDQQNRITYIADKLKGLLEQEGIFIKAGDHLSAAMAERICELLCQILLSAVGLGPKTKYMVDMATNHGIHVQPELFTFSGGVADCIGQPWDDFAFGDIGVILGRVLRRSEFFKDGRTVAAAQTLRATVIGAGACSMLLSGSTIEYQNGGFPRKNIPVRRLSLAEKTEIEDFAQQMQRSIQAADLLGNSPICAVSFHGLKTPSFGEIERLAEEIVKAESALAYDGPIIIVMEEDMGKALGQALKRRLKKGRAFICVDGVACYDGDFIDIGPPVANGKAVPVVVKTLVFQ